ncbi:heme-binding domain-containing protein [Adhaeribacter aquaticus]|uniref:heme-binding domain-containing protein n=1 Tax=Adhaeribacter aquaticus TaxID=299567 RepID=UPI00047BF98B|nr:heme-binding domain-containing protein [Adhaeribacter aquaticus]
MKKKILIALLFIFVAIQFIRPAQNKGQAETPQDVTHFVNVPADVMHILKTSCYDCHSNNTRYPWYAHVNPVGLWLQNHIEEGKDELNFSDFAQYDKKKMDHKLEEVEEMVQDGHMPLPAYLSMHTDAKLSEDQKNVLINWVKTERQKLGVTAE